MDQHQKYSLPSHRLISTIINMNNEGVAHIMSGNYKTAITTLSYALKKSCKHVASRDGQADSRTSLDEYMTLRSSNNSNEDENEDGDEQVIYRRAIVVPETQRDSLSSKTGQNTAAATTMSTIIIFNEAIAHHLMALEVMIRQENRAFEILRKAAKLYEIGLTLAREGEMCSSGSLFVLASINNMALVYRAMRVNDVADLCLEQLLATLMIVIDCGDSVTFDGFFANTSCLIFSASPAAAA